MSHDMDWNDGPPPFVGWWNASTIWDTEEWRWWDGKAWSVQVLPKDTPADAAHMASHATILLGVQWTWYWPEGARVPRYFPKGYVQRELDDALATARALDVQQVPPHVAAQIAALDRKAGRVNVRQVQAAVAEDDEIDF